MKIIIESIPHAQQRYDTIGDWFVAPDGTLHIKVSQDKGVLPNRAPTKNEQFLIALHELVEMFVCASQGVTQKMVDDFDMYPAAKSFMGEPGDMPNCPYAKQHRFAMLIEHLVAHELGMLPYGRVE